ncbi:MAG: hypothetical protein Q7J06_07270 [Bacteroidales bacterium]|nr:hypothetical protein [Bacteroidales bacterium]
MNENANIYKGIVDEERNPFSIPSWCKEHRTRDPEGSGREMQQTAIENFQMVVAKGGRIKDIIKPHHEKYATFQAIRWGYAEKQGDRIVPTGKWEEISPKRRINKSYTKSIAQERSISRDNRLKKTVTRDVSCYNSSNNLSQSELVEKLKSFDLNVTIRNYLNKDNLKDKSALQIFKYHTFGNSIARAFHYESPSGQYRYWVDQINITEVLTMLSKISNQNEYDTFLFEIADSLVRSWDEKNKKGGMSKMNIGISLKIMNLLMKHLTFVHIGNNSKLINYLHVPWDKYTLQPLCLIWKGYPRIDSSSSQGFVKNIAQYLGLQTFITNIVTQAGVDRIAYEFWAWDKEH